jgi:Ca2+-binding EF-hand superfamily protein
MDDNGDGILSKKEFLTPINERFEKMDLNSDGVLRRKEIRKALKKSRKDSTEKGVREKGKPKPFIKH